MTYFEKCYENSDLVKLGRHNILGYLRAPRSKKSDCILIEVHLICKGSFLKKRVVKASSARERLKSSGQNGRRASRFTGFIFLLVDPENRR